MFFISLFIFISSFFTKKMAWLLILFFMQSFVFLLARISLVLFFKRTLFIIPALLGILVLNYSIFPMIFLKSLTALLSISLITSNFDIGKISSFLKKLSIPSYLIEIFILAFRYSHTFVDEVKMIQMNLWLRGVFAKKHILKSSFLGPLIGNMFLRSLKKSEKVHLAMKLRGY